ncbi:hypothetical protein Patl1_18813 [Pistacia atlantica]|uniref:Uncharacterized protein n=1 Tax=Pistacia atlantica TaxID=434234 RepID=A0ACC1C2X0_9ROSI|nr:hypothetical protein Patl1_18813 [Pistacia atlantica]
MNSSSSSPQRSRSNNNHDDRPRFFDSKTKSKCWENAPTVPGRHPERWRKDAADNIVCKRFCNCHGCLCFQYDHIVPFSKGGESTVDNCQILQTRVNRFKSDKEVVDKNQLQGYSCDVKFTGQAKIHSILLLYVWYDCNQFQGQSPGSSSTGIVRKDKELDIIEMAVYGDVIRPGNQCCCKTVAEMLGKYKPKDPLAACKLPQDGESL